MHFPVAHRARVILICPSVCRPGLVSDAMLHELHRALNKEY
jgi:hypothetical protein